MAELLVQNITQLNTMVSGAAPILDGAVAFEAGEVVYVGPSSGAPQAAQVVNGEGMVGLPGLVDCHTHTLYAGSRSNEFERRLAGEDYTAILQAGGGILSTVRATRLASDADLGELVSARLLAMRALGVTSVEIKTGYGLDLQTELRCLRLLALGEWPVRVLSTWLGAHALPPEFAGRRQAYVEHLVTEMLPQIAPFADMADVYCDVGAFDLADTERILRAAKQAGLGLRVHAEQVAYTGSAALAAGLGASSADHLERLDQAGIDAMALAGTVAVLLPGAMLYLRDSSPPVAALRAAGVPLAVATDFNPGSSPVRDLWCAASLACVSMGLSVQEALAGITRVAGQALGRPELGWLGQGSAADMALFRTPPGEPADAASLIQFMGAHQAQALVQGGRLTQGG
ncbi:MAG: imidazolonepropionase [Cognaticolwellia sp.]|jgi:imidazolonepropionase